MLWKMRKDLIDEGLESGAVRSDTINDLEAILVKLRYLLDPAAATRYKLIATSAPRRDVFPKGATRAARDARNAMTDAQRRRRVLGCNRERRRAISFLCLEGSVAMELDARPARRGPGAGGGGRAGRSCCCRARCGRSTCSRAARLRARRLGPDGPAAARAPAVVGAGGRDENAAPTPARRSRAALPGARRTPSPRACRRWRRRRADRRRSRRCSSRAPRAGARRLVRERDKDPSRRRRGATTTPSRPRCWASRRPRQRRPRVLQVVPAPRARDGALGDDGRPRGRGREARQRLRRGPAPVGRVRRARRRLPRRRGHAGRRHAPRRHAWPLGRGDFKDDAARCVVIVGVPRAALRRGDASKSSTPTATAGRSKAEAPQLSRPRAASSATRRTTARSSSSTAPSTSTR